MEYLKIFMLVSFSAISGWYVWKVKRKDRRKMERSEWFGVVGPVLFALVIVFSPLKDNPREQASVNQVVDAQSAKRFLLDTWTYTDPITDPSYISQWEKWVVKADGTVDVFRAEPISNDWGKPETVEYEIFQGKFTDTGKVYFGLRLKKTVVRAIIVDDDRLAFLVSDSNAVTMRRGDRNPFSKI
ncbi:TPA: hypothetical protein QDB24_002202 [Burkholderia vietnamiensis]|uniref:hypothetical protein n=1 Tax=Burkholderia vietnamiensis TaxID=60552 RepID=UPI001592E5A9|nr:hypothetical protein [Burkholderia vietnamiensis]MBR7910118.1 hypothetical protein [Burkholderia vietnamiensis]HDR9102994.1 hypothetical protein [Burkholderia vietnamiensis]HDR9274142.1 hypothetical protein [Burkholderia vietnamiensis]